MLVTRKIETHFITLTASRGGADAGLHRDPFQAAQKGQNMKTTYRGASLGALAFALISPAAAQDSVGADAAEEQRGGVPSIIVTAQKRTEDLQDVPISVSAIGSQQLDELNIDTFEDYLEQLPTVTAGGNGPGQSTMKNIVS